MNDVPPGSLCPFASATPLGTGDSSDFQTIIETSLEPFVSVDAQGAVTAWNAQAVKTFGWSRAEALGSRIGDLIVPPELRERHCTALAAFKFGAESSVIGRRVRMPSYRRDGSPLVVELQVAATVAPDGTNRFHAFIRDITLLEQTREDMVQRERLLADSQRIAHLGSYWHDLETGEVVCSEELFEILKLRGTHFNGKIEELLAFIHPDDRADAIAKYKHAVKTGLPYDFEHRTVRTDGSIRIVRRRGVVTRNELGRSVRVSATIHDITEQREADAARYESDARFTRSFEDSPFGLALIGAKPEEFGRFVLVNDAFGKMLARDVKALETVAYQSIIHVDDVAASLEAATNLAVDGQSRDSELRLRGEDGEVIWIRQHLSLLRDDTGAPLHFFAHVENITARRADRAAFAEIHERLRRSIEDAPIGMALVDVGSSAHVLGRFREANAALCALTGYDRDCLATMDLASIVDPRDYPAVAASFAEMLGGETDRLANDARYVHSDGSQRWFSLHLSLVRDALSEPRYAIVQIVDSTEAKRSTKRMAHLAHHDALTRLLNRRGLERRLKRYLAGGDAAREALSVMMLDIDYFKYVNDSFGHAMGDNVLKALATTLRSEATPRDFVARLGGDEFIMVMPGVLGAEALERASRVRDGVTRDIAMQTQGRIHATASVGITTVDVGATFSFDDALAAADMALATAKEDGRDRTIVAESLVDSHRTLRGRMEWARRIRTALAEGDFRLYRQPILNLATGRIDRYEFLLRMIASDGTTIGPAHFMGEAERFGLLVEIDTWVVTEAIRIAAAQQRHGIMDSYEVNLSAASLADENIVPRVKAELERTGAIPQLLVFELTETTAIRNMEKASRLIEALSALGCRFALDDFGAGFSSFYYLKRLPFDYLKIDGEFIANITENEADRQIVQSIVQLAQGLKKKTIAEFVGSDPALELVTRFGVDFAQGYHVGMPEAIPELALI